MSAAIPTYVCVGGDCDGSRVAPDVWRRAVAAVLESEQSGGGYLDQVSAAQSIFREASAAADLPSDWRERRDRVRDTIDESFRAKLIEICAWRDEP